MTTMTTLPGHVDSAIRTIGFDTATCVSARAAADFVAGGFGFCARYLSRSTQSEAPTYGKSALSIQEANDLLGAGLAITPVQFGDNTLVPSASKGTTVGQAAANNAAQLGFPQGVTIWCDLEWKQVPSSTDDTIAYANAWAAAVQAGGYEPGLYVGMNMGLSSSQLYYKLSFAHYWKSASEVPWVETRGFQMVQGLHQTLNGISVDPDLVMLDNERQVFQWLKPS